MRTLRQNLFRSHLLVIVVALLVAGIGAGLFGILFSLFDEGSLRGKRGGPLALVVPITAAVLASGIVSWFVTRRMTASLDGVRHAAARLAGGDYGTRVGHSDIEELRELGDSMNVLAEALEQTERRRLELIGDVAHELRNPLATIQASMEGLMDGVTPADDTTFAGVGEQAARLSRLARDLSELSASSEWTSMDRFEPLDLSDLVADVIAQLAPQAGAKDLSVRFDRPATPLRVVTDRDRLTQVLVNVVGNAIQYSDQGEIVIAAQTDRSSAVITVRDAGRGLAAGDTDRIFERFYRVDRSYADGTGVGLAIAKAIVDAHGGSIAASSPGLGSGTTVRISLPFEGPTL